MLRHRVHPEELTLDQVIRRRIRSNTYFCWSAGKTVSQQAAGRDARWALCSPPRIQRTSTTKSRDEYCTASGPLRRRRGARCLVHEHELTWGYWVILLSPVTTIRSCFRAVATIMRSAGSLWNSPGKEYASCMMSSVMSRHFHLLRPVK